MNGSSKYLDDGQSLKALVDCLTLEDRSEYKEYKSLAKESAFPGRRFVVYTLLAGKPSNCEFLSCGRLQMNTDGALELEIASDQSPYPFAVSMVPVRVPGREVYLHIPQNFELKWKAKAGETGITFAAHFALLIKTRSNVRRREEGHTYCARLNEFNELFPEAKARY